MLPVQVLLLLQCQPRQLLVYLFVLPLLVVPLHPKQQQRGQNEDTATCRQIEPISNMIVRLVKRQKAPGTDQASYIPQHNIGTNGTRTRRVANNVGGYLCIAQRTERKGAGGDEEGGTVTGLCICGGEEHDVTYHHEGCGDDEEDTPTIKPPG